MTTPDLLSAPNPCGRPSRAQWIWAALFMASLALGTMTLARDRLPAGVRYSVPLLSLVAGALYLRAMVRDLRRQSDELQLRIYLESTAFAYHGLFVAALVYPVFQKAGLLGPLDYSVVLFLMAGLGLGGFLLAARRYR